MPRHIGCFVWFLLATLASAEAQTRGLVPRPGQEIRFRRPDRSEATGVVREVRSHAVLAEVGRDTFPLSPRDLAESQVRIGTKAATLKGMAAGTWIGVLVGGFAGIAAQESCASECFLQGAYALGGAYLGAVTGSVLGAAIGSTHKTGIWISPATPLAPVGEGAESVPVPGDRVRVRTGKSVSEGTLLSWQDETMEIRTDDGSLLGASAMSVERYVGERSVLGHRLLIGAGTGAALGLALSSRDESGTADIGTYLASAAAMASLGMLAAAVIPNRTRAHFEAVQPASGRMESTWSLRPGYENGRVRLGLRMEF